MKRQILIQLLFLATFVFVISCEKEEQNIPNKTPNETPNIEKPTIPDCVSPVFPTNGQTNVETNAVLSWSAIANADSYDVYLGTSTNNQGFVGNTSATTYMTALQEGTQYFWKVIAKNTAGEAIGCDKWHFTTLDSRDKYIGIWKFKQIGSLSMYYAGDVIETMPINDNGTYSISKSGKYDLSIGGKIFTINGNSLSSNSYTETGNDSDLGISMQLTYTVTSGTLSDNVIVINEDLSGTWMAVDNGTTISGIMSGTLQTTLTR